MDVRVDVKQPTERLDHGHHPNLEASARPDRRGHQFP
jgi:hypothetical protein